MRDRMILDVSVAVKIINQNARNILLHATMIPFTFYMYAVNFQ